MEKVIAYGVLKLLDTEIPCAVLEGEKRVLVQRELVGLLTGNKKGGFDRYFKPKNLQPYVPEKFKNKKLEEVVHSFIWGGFKAQGFEAEDIVNICDMYIRAKNDGNLLTNQKKLAEKSYLLMKSYAKVGLVALIDEATGYQKYRNGDALRILVEKYIIEEARDWTKEFYDQFWLEMDRIYENNKTTSRNRPLYYANFINKYIYSPIENGIILKKLDELNPVGPKGSRKKRLHQFLSEEQGLRVLRDRISKITGILQISPNKSKFESNYARLESKQLWLFDELNEN